MQLTKVFALAAASAVFCGPIFAQSPAPAASAAQTLSTRVVAYQIEAKLDPTKHTIAASETLTYKNLTGQPQQTFPFHLYLNAFQPQSTFMTEVRRSGTRGSGPDTAWDPKHFGSITIDKLEVEGAGDLTNKLQFIQPDDHNTDDHTVVQITLPKPVAPGASVEFHIAFHEVLPKVVERTGYAHDFDMVGQWFPKVGVWWKNAWNCHQFHANTEFFADFGTFDVKITVPQNRNRRSDGGRPRLHRNEFRRHQDAHLPFRRRPRFFLDRQPQLHRRRRFLDRQPRPRKNSLADLSPGHESSAERYITAVQRHFAPLRRMVRPLSLRSHHHG